MIEPMEFLDIEEIILEPIVNTNILTPDEYVGSEFLGIFIAFVGFLITVRNRRGDNKTWIFYLGLVIMSIGYFLYW